MAGQLIPPPDLAPPTPSRLSSEQRIALWADLTDTCEQFLMAGLRMQLGPDGDVRAAYRNWYARQMEEHDRTMIRMMEELAWRSSEDAR
jgi:hypothetical protein